MARLRRLKVWVRSIDNRARLFNVMSGFKTWEFSNRDCRENLVVPYPSSGARLG
jgi:hypothetical protein